MCRPPSADNRKVRSDGAIWTELKLRCEDEAGAADFLHACWRRRYYGFIKRGE